MTFEQAAQTVVNDLGWIIAFVVWTAIVLSIGQFSCQNTMSDKDKTYHEVNRIYESQIEILREPREEGYGLALRDIDLGVELIRIAEKDGNYYRSSHFTVYEGELEIVADELSYYACEQEREVVE